MAKVKPAGEKTARRHQEQRRTVDQRRLGRGEGRAPQETECDDEDRDLIGPQEHASAQPWFITPNAIAVPCHLEIK